MRGFPTILFINDAGKVEDTIGGYMPPQGFSQKIKEALSLHDLPNLQAQYRSNPKDVRALAKLVNIYSIKGDVTQASALLAQEAKLDPRNATGLLSKSYSAVGDYYQSRDIVQQAIPLFRKAADAGKSPYDLAYAHISIAMCYMSRNKRNEALREFKATEEVPNCPPDIKSQAQQAIIQLSQGGSH